MKITDFNALIAGFTNGGSNTASELRTMLSAIRDSTLIPNEIKYIFVSSAEAPAFLSANFTNGLGNTGTIFDGFAIKGTNGTTLADGITHIGYGTNYSLGATGGEATHTLTESKLPKLEGLLNTILPDTGASNGIITVLGSSPASIGGSPSSFSHKDLKIAFGNNEAHNNMQPYEVVLIIQRIS